MGRKRDIRGLEPESVWGISNPGTGLGLFSGPWGTSIMVRARFPFGIRAPG